MAGLIGELIKTCLLVRLSVSLLAKVAVASLGWVTPGAATEGVTLYFFPEKPGDHFFSRQFCGVIPVSSSQNLATFFCHPTPFFAHLCHFHYRFLLLSHGCRPLQGVTPHLFYLSDLVSLLFFVNLPTKIFFLRMSPPGGCHPGRSTPNPLVTPLQGGTNHMQ